MKHKLELLRPIGNINAYGEETPTTYELTSTIHAERVKISGARSEEVGEHFAEYRAEFNIRDAHAVSEGWRVREKGGCEYTVTAIIPNIDRGMKTLVCVKVNP